MLRVWLGISLLVAGWVAAFAPLGFSLSSFLHLLNCFISPHSFSCLCSGCSVPCPAGWEEVEQPWCSAGLSQGTPGAPDARPCCFQAQLQRQLSETLQRCPQALFVFDEAEKLHSSLLDAIKPFMAHHDTNHQRAIFLFLR